MRIYVFLFAIGITMRSCSVYNAKDYNTYYYNLHRTTTDKFKPTKQLTTYDYTDNNIKYFQENGYVMIGYDAIRHTYIDYQEAINAGCWIGATVMLYKHQYIGTATGTTVVPVYNPGDTYILNSRTSGSVSANSTTSASAYGSNGYAYGSSYSSGYGTYNSNTTSTLTTPGSFSYYSAPYSNDYYDQYAVYFVKTLYRIEQEVKLFQKESVSSKQLAMVEKNSWFEVIYKGDKYTKIKYKGTVGYVSNSYLVLK